MKQYGLIGKSLSHSFSKNYFEQKFEKEGITDANYSLFELAKIKDFQGLIENENLSGLNVTIPYKEAIIPFLDSIDPQAKAIGAVNTIKINKNGRMTGYNTDHFGFAKSLEDCIPWLDKTALVLGTGGASKAIIYVLKTLGFTVCQVSRSPIENGLTYGDISRSVLEQHQLIVNCTPLGTYPDLLKFPSIPYQYITSHHMLYDLIYNPVKTEFLKLGQASNARIKNGQKMLEHQALKSWSIWTRP